MSEQEQMAVVYALKQDYEKIIRERDIARESLLQIADGYEALAQQIRKDMSFQTWDADSMRATASELAEKSASYKQLLAKADELKTRLEPYRDLFKPLD
jgi:hypothetical protein